MTISAKLFCLNFLYSKTEIIVTVTSQVCNDEDQMHTTHLAQCLVQRKPSVLAFTIIIVISSIINTVKAFMRKSNAFCEGSQIFLA